MSASDTDATWGTVEDCPCGKPHTLSGDAWQAYQRAATSGVPTIQLTVDGRRWAVPRIWVAVHHFKGPEIPALAARYGWKEVHG